MGLKGETWLFLYCWSGPSPGTAVEADISEQLVQKYQLDWGPLAWDSIKFLSDTGASEGDRENFMIAFALKGGASKDQVGKTMVWHVDTPSGAASYFIIPATSA